MSVTVVIRRFRDGFIGYVPDIPGCVAFSQKLNDIDGLLIEAVASHRRSLAEVGLPMPSFTSISKTIQIPGVASAKYNGFDS